MAKKKDKKLAEISELAAEYKKFKLIAVDANKDAEEAKKPIIAFMQKNRMGTTTINGVKITLTEGETAEYDLEGFKRDLPRKVFKRITVRVLSKDALLSLVNQGIISKKIFAKHTHMKTKKPYITVTLDVE